MKITGLVSASSHNGKKTNTFCLLKACAGLGIDVRDCGCDGGQGPWWYQHLSRGMYPCLTDGTEAILTIDYDSVFTIEHLQGLIEVFQDNPHIDALAPVQQRRGEMEGSIYVNRDEKGTMILEAPPAEFDERASKVETAHFGLTLIRVSSLAQMGHPWFVGVPNSEGKWEDGRVDPDIYFWRKWATEGLTLYLANRIRIGHLQTIITWPDVRYKNVNMPEEAWWEIQHSKGET